MTDFASLGIELDSRPVVEGTAALDRLVDTSARVEKSMQGMNGQMNDTAQIMKSQAEAARSADAENQKFLATLQREIDLYGLNRAETEKYKAAALGLTNSTQQQAAALGASLDAMKRDEEAARALAAAEDQATRAGDAFIKKLNEQVATLGMNTQQLQAYRAAQLGVSDAASPLIAKLAEAGAGAKGAGGHLDGLSFSSAGAKRELIVLAHELSQGNYSKFGGSMMVIGEQTGAASLLFSAAGLAALGLTAAVAGVGYAMIKGASEQKEMNNALVMTGNYAGVTSDSLNGLAHAAVAAGGSIGEAKKVATELAASGKYSGEQIGIITEATVAWEHATGKSTDSIIKAFESLAVQTTGSSARATEAVSRATVKLDDQYHFLTESVYEQIRALEKEGDAKGASALATETFAKATHDRAEEILANLGTVARAWNAVKEAVGGATDAVGNWGKKATPATEVQRLQKEIGQIDNGSYSSIHGGDSTAFSGKTLEAIRAADIVALNKAALELMAVDANAAKQRDAALAQSEAVHAASRVTQDDQKLQKKGMSELAIAMDAYHADIDKIKAANPDSALVTPEAIAAHEAALTKAHTPAPVKGNDDRAKTLQDDLLKQQTALASETSIYEARNQMLSTYHAKFGQSDEAYYAGRNTARAEYIAAEAISYAKEKTLIESFKSKNPEEVAANKVKYDELLKQHTAFTEKMSAAQGEDALNDLAAQKLVSDASDAAANKYVSDLNKQAAELEKSVGAHERSKSAVEEETVALYKLAVANAAAQVVAPVTETHTDADVASAQQILNILQQELAAHERISAALKDQEALQFQQKAADQAIKDWQRAGASISESLSTAFGSGGKALGAMFKAYADGNAAQLRAQKALAAAKKLSDDDPEKIKAIDQAHLDGTTAQVKSYGDMAGAAQGFFKEGSKGYAAMGAAAQVLHAAEVALTVVKGINAVLTQGEGDPYTAFGRMAAMAAIVVGLGVALSGGGGGGQQTTAQRQAATGTGSVLGDENAKSDSIKNSLEIVAKNSGLGLAHTISMDVSLKQLVAGIGSLASVLVRNSGLTGTTAADSTGAASNLAQKMVSGPLAVLLGGPIGAISTVLDKITGGLVSKITGKITNAIFGGNTTTLDTGLTIGKTTLGAAAAGSVVASQYADTKTDGGWFSSDKYKTSLAALGSAADDQFTLIFKNLADTVKASATALGLGGTEFENHLSSFVIDIGKISTKGLTGTEIQTALENAISKVGDDLAQFSVAGLAEYTKVGEGYLETLTRVANDSIQVSDVLAVLGKSFNATGLGAVKLSEGLILAAGDLDTLTTNTSYFVENFLSESERMAPIVKSVQTALGALGVQNVTTVDQFKDLVLAQDLSTTAGQTMYAALIALAPQFKAAADYTADLAAATGQYTAVVKSAADIASEHKDLQSQLNDLTLTDVQLLALQRDGIADVNKSLFDQVQLAKKVADGKTALATAYTTESTAMQAAIDKTKSFATSLRTFTDGLALGSSSTLTPEQQYAEAQKQFESTLAAAKGGDATAQSGLQAAETALLAASKVVNASDSQYAADYARVVNANEEAIKWASTQVDVQQASLDALTKLVSGYVTINDSINSSALTVVQAIQNLALLGYTGINGSHAGGLVSTPYDGYIAELHAGEPVIDAPAAAALRRYFGGTGPSNGGASNTALVAEIKALRAEVAGLRADQQQQTGDLVVATYDANDRNAAAVNAGTADATNRKIRSEKVTALA